MKIAIAHRHFNSTQAPDQHVMRYIALLEQHGHEVAPFAMAHPKNLPTPWSKYFVSAIDASKVRFTWQGFRTFCRLLYSFEARKKFGALLDEFKPDVVHAFGIQPQLSGSVLAAARERKLPVVGSVFDHALVSPNYFLYHDGAICERTKQARFWRAVPHRCVKHSYFASGAAALAMYVQRWAGVDWRALDRVVTPSAYIKRKYEEYGIDGARMTPVPYAMPTEGWTPKYTGDYALCVGRLSPEKGPLTLIRAAAQVPDMPLKIVGTGPQEAECRALAKELGATNIEFLGFVEDLTPVRAGARFVIVQAACYDAAPTTTLEAYAAGKPVLGADIGGISEQVIEGETGRHYRPDDVDDLVAKMTAMWFSPVGCEAMGRNARERAETEYAPETHYARMMEVYKSVGVH
jgi:glycosyltransferase involved in cell wall biosynthesis